VWETIKIAFERMGIDWRGVVNYAPGDADVVNAFLVHPEVAGMSFTGSSAVLNDIKRNHDELMRYGWVGRAKLVYGSAETSGVNTFTVCADADPVHAAQEYVKAFIGRSGQKCSSARIAFVHDSVYHAFVEAMIERLKQVRYGDVKEGADLGAMITAADRDKLVRQIAEMEEARLLTLLYQKEITHGSGHDFPPTVLLSAYGLRDDEKRKLMNTEFFGPASTIVKFANLDQVEQMCAMTDFALTGSVFTKDLEVLRHVLNFIPAGNVYWNRKCTGALVETECFGGLRSASSPSGMKGKNALALFGSQPTFSGCYPKDATLAEKKAYAKMFQEEGLNLSKS
jgi:acyl-CoA reductase-like NAD-dependent aldehyde dehydrogenase